MKPDRPNGKLDSGRRAGSVGSVGRDCIGWRPKGRDTPMGFIANG